MGRCSSIRGRSTGTSHSTSSYNSQILVTTEFVDNNLNGITGNFRSILPATYFEYDGRLLWLWLLPCWMVTLLWSLLLHP